MWPISAKSIRAFALLERIKGGKKYENTKKEMDGGSNGGSNGCDVINSMRDKGNIGESFQRHEQTRFGGGLPAYEHEAGYEH